MDEWLLYEHEDGGYAAAPNAAAATFAAGDPAWHRIGPVMVPADRSRAPERGNGPEDRLVPIDGPAAVDLHVQKILQSEELGSEFARCSTTEAVMVAIALCDRRFLPAPLRDEPGRDLWRRLDARQRAAVTHFGQRAG